MLVQRHCRRVASLKSSWEAVVTSCFARVVCFISLFGLLHSEAILLLSTINIRGVLPSWTLPCPRLSMIVASDCMALLTFDFKRSSRVHLEFQDLQGHSVVFCQSHTLHWSGCTFCSSYPLQTSQFSFVLSQPWVPRSNQTLALPTGVLASSTSISLLTTFWFTFGTHVINIMSEKSFSFIFRPSRSV